MRLHEILIGGALAAAIAVPAAKGRAPEAIYLPAERVAAAFAKGRPLHETEGYKVHASRRDAPGMAEVHLRDTDVIYVVEGRATFVTGGSLDGGETVTAGELRAAAILGGSPRSLAKGDVVVVPRGVPHQFTEVAAPFLYYVVKVEGPGGAK